MNWTVTTQDVCKVETLIALPNQSDVFISDSSQGAAFCDAIDASL